MPIPKVRTTVTLDHDLVERFAEVASKEQRSFSFIINKWLQQVIQPAEFVAAQVDHDIAASAERLRSLMGAVQVVNEQASAAVGKARGLPSATAPRRAKRGGVEGPDGKPPRPVIRGGNYPLSEKQQTEKGSL